VRVSSFSPNLALWLASELEMLVKAFEYVGHGDGPGGGLTVAVKNWEKD
jgi:hypothetical protein